MPITGAYVNVQGIKTYYETNNGPHNPKGTIIALPTAGRESRQFHGIMEYLEDRYTVIAPDLPAHGKSWPLPGLQGIKTYQEYGKFVWDFIQTLGIEDPVVLGCSFSGNMVLHIASTYPVKAAIACQASSYIKAMGSSYGTTILLLDNPYVSPQHSHWDFSESLIGRDCPKEAHDLIMWGVCQEIGRAKIADMSIYNNFDVREDLKNLTCPLLLVRGEDDWNVPDHYFETAMEYITNSRKLEFKKVPRYGHFIVVEAPAIVSELIDEFLPEEA